jgi:hypothetical protein
VPATDAGVLSIKKKVTSSLQTKKVATNIAQFRISGKQNKKITKYLQMSKNCRIFAAVFSEECILRVLLHISRNRNNE